MHKYASNLLPASFQGLFTRLSDTDERNNRDAFYNYKVTNPKMKALNRFPRVVFPQLWNSLSSLLQSTGTHKIFKSDLKKALIENNGNFVACDNLQCTECKIESEFHWYHISFIHLRKMHAASRLFLSLSLSLLHKLVNLQWQMHAASCL